PGDPAGSPHTGHPESRPPEPCLPVYTGEQCLPSKGAAVAKAACSCAQVGPEPAGPETTSSLSCKCGPEWRASGQAGLQ
ncbi:hypothetical protein P7K49_005761, partial [Saguinus oedipus]